VTLLLAALALQQVPPPRGVNNEVLGTAEEFRVDGPARVCLSATSIDLRPGESAYLDYLGIHFGSIRVVGAHGSFLLTQGSFADPQRPGQLVQDPRGRVIERFRRDGRPRYMFFAQPEDTPDDDVPVAVLEGDALGRSRDYTILSRVNIDLDGPAGCQRQFLYGLDYVEGGSELE
jgi:hypothetical protein